MMQLDGAFANERFTQETDEVCAACGESEANCECDLPYDGDEYAD